MIFTTYPILGERGYPIEAEFSHNVDEPQIENGFVLVNVTHSLKNTPAIENLIKEEKAIYCVRLKCTNRFFTQTVSSYSETVQLKIPDYELTGDHFRLESSIISTLKQSFLATDADSKAQDFVGDWRIECSLLPGSVLAVCESEYELEYNPSQFIEIKPYANEDSSEIKVNFSSENIVIKVPTAAFSSYEMTADLKRTEDIDPLLQLWVTMEALTKIRYEYDTYCDKKWASKIISIAEEVGHTLEEIRERDGGSISEIADNIVENAIYKTLMKSVPKENDYEGEQGD
jgi:hypothetical protein